MTREKAPMQGIAVIGMAGRFPGAKGIDAFWENLKNGVESITRFTDDDLEVHPNVESGVQYVKARGVLEGVDLFDAAFFGYTPREAEVMDPQHRVFLECAWEALENAGYDAERYPGLIGLYAGLSMNTYLLFNLCFSRDFVEQLVHSHQVGTHPALLGNDKDFLTTRVSYKLNLKGPSVTVQTACSTSLVAVSSAWQSLMSYQCDMALAGGVSISFPQRRSYAYQEGAMVSSDGHCRAFDADAQGMLYGAGVGIVVLKRVEDAIADGDRIYGVIIGAATNNDGAAKVSYMAPSVDGQAGAIITAQTLAGVTADTISYVETHGTGTPLGDPIEIAALTQAFRATTQAKQFCAIGSVKTNIGHLEAAAGVSGLLKTILSLYHGQLPPTLNFRRPNPKIDFENSPFFVNAQLREWKSDSSPRRAGVSSFGVGGTNAHVVLEEAPPKGAEEPSRPWQVLALSAKTTSALDKMTGNLAAHFERHPSTNLADVAYTLQLGRRRFNHKCVLVCRDVPEALERLKSGSGEGRMDSVTDKKNPPVVFMFPGQGSQYVDMGRELYEREGAFREIVDHCAEFLKGAMGEDIRDILYPKESGRGNAASLIQQTRVTQPALFVIEYALAKLWMLWGVKPAAMIGHSVGEYVAACVAGVFTVEDGLRLLAARGRLIQELPGGSMLAIRLPEDKVGAYLTDGISIAAINTPSLCVVSGPLKAIANLEQKLTAEGVGARQLATSHAFHSSMMEPVLDRFEKVVQSVKLSRGTIPFLSNLSATWITGAETVDPSYWVKHLRQPVRFSDSVRELVKDPGFVLMEVGPGQTLANLVKQHPTKNISQTVLSSLQYTSVEKNQDMYSVAVAMGRLLLAGIEPDWSGYYSRERRTRVPLPTYPFERKRFWIEPPRPSPSRSEENPASSFADYKPTPDQGGESPEKESTMRAVSQAESAGRRDGITGRLVTLLKELSGLEDSALSVSASFMELGFDSLFLTQASQAVQKQFGVKVTFRQMLDQLSSIETLASYLDSQLPPDQPPQNPVAAPAGVPGVDSMRVSSTVTASTQGAVLPDNSVLERIMAQQLQVMKEQLEMLRKGSQAGMPIPSGAIAKQPPPPSSQPMIPSAPASASAESQKEFKRFGPYKPIEKGAQGTLTDRQRQHIEKLIARYTSRTRQSKEYAQQHRHHLADPRVVSGFKLSWKEMVYPIVATRSSGSKIWDLDGNEYIDILNGFGLNFFGHSPEFVTEALRAQLNLGVEIGPQAHLAGQVAELVSELTGMERVTFCNTGSEAVMAAMRLARTVTGRNKVVLFAGDYHGMFDEVLVRATTIGGELRSAPIAPGIPQSLVDNIIVLEYGSPKSLDIIRALGAELAAVMVEPVQSRRPDLQPKEFLHELRSLTLQSGTALIFDEVVTGFRCDPGGAQAWFGVRADMATYGKVAGGGMPIGIVAGNSRFMDALDGGMWQYGDSSVPEVGVTFVAGTFVRHPLAMAAAYAVLSRLKSEGPQLQEGLTRKTAKFTGDLNRYFEEQQIPLRLPHFSGFFMIDHPHDLKFSSLLWYHLREKGVHAWEGFPCFLTLAHTDQDLEMVTNAFKESVAEMREGGVFPESSSALTEGLRETGEKEETVVRTPLTEAQKEIWISTRMGNDASCTFNESNTIHLEGVLDIPALQHAFQSVIQRHDALKSRFSHLGEYQEFVPSITLDLPLVDLSSFSPEEQERRFEEIIAREGEIPFDLEQGPMIRGQVVRFSPTKHKLVITEHHLVCDGWSFGVVIHELATVYTNLRKSNPVMLPDAMQFSEYARLQVEQQKSPDVAASEVYWVQQFADSVPVLELPTDRPRPAVKTYNGSLATRSLSAQLYEELKVASAKRGNTLFSTLLSVYSVLLHRLTGQDDIVVGIPAAGQVMVGSNELVGHCLNFLPMRIKIDSPKSFAAFSADVKRGVLDAYDHQDFTYGTLIQKLKLPRDTGRHPLLSTLFNIDRGGYDSLHFEELRTEISTNPKRFVNFDIFFNLVQTDEALDLECEFNTDLFDRKTIERWLGHFETIVAGILQDPEAPVSTVPVLSEAEHSMVLTEFNDTQREYTRGKCLHQLIEDQVARTPDVIAVAFEHQLLTYRELNKRANQLAHHLIGLGVGPDVLVGICAERSIEMVVGLLGILKAGGAYVPIDPDYPAERVAFMFEDADVRVLLTQKKLSVSLPVHVHHELLLDADWGEIGKNPDENPSVQIAPEHLAYTIYTSGSTGKPKGAMNTHAGICNRMHWMQEQYQIGQADSVLQKTPFSFDVSVWEFFWPLMTGARLVVSRPGGHQDPTYLMQLIDRERITVIHFVPSMLRAFLADLNAGQCASLRHVICSGEVLSYELQELFFARLCTVRLYNLYGPTEAAVDVTFWECKKGDGRNIVPLGRAVANTELYILDSNLQPVPVGVTGELHIGGVQVGRGYHNRSDLTAAKFIPHPFTMKPAERLYKTGDLARYLPDGNIEYLGRTDHQVKVRGFRIELGEIESVLGRHPGVREIVVMVREDVPDEKRIAAYVVRNVNGLPGVEELRDYLRERLPEYMVPTVIMFLEKMPLGPNGKIDRRALPVPDTARPELKQEYVAPRTEIEKKLATIWEEVLHVGRVGVQDDVFALGADSLLIFQMSVRAKQLNLGVSPRNFFQYRTIALMAAFLNETRTTQLESSGGTIPVQARETHRVRRPKEPLLGKN